MAENEPSEDSSPGRATVGMIGLGVMGRNLSLNLADHGYNVAAFDLDAAAVPKLIEEDRAETPGGKPGAISGCESVSQLLADTTRPRIIIVLVPAGPAVDKVCDSLIEAGIEPDDIVIDCGNSRWTDTIRREQSHRGRLTFFGSGVSGGEVGARFGPSLMPGGDAGAWSRLRPIWESIAARVDPATGAEITGARPGEPVTTGEPCTAYIGTDGAGHYVKMVHNGIEYADMQLICEAYSLLRAACPRAGGKIGLEPEAIADVFAEWNEGELAGYLIEITADILREDDPKTGRPLVDVILDAAGQKGTGRWTAQDALELGVPAPTIAEAVFARSLSAQKEERLAAAERYAGPAGGSDRAPDAFIDDLRAALYCSKIGAYAQGFRIMREAQEEYGWDLNFASIARIWRGGCIIRAALLQEIAEAYERDPGLSGLLLDASFQTMINERSDAWRRTVQAAAGAGVPAPGLGSALAYFDGCRSAVLPANLLQAQRDYFGAHGYERTDQPRGRKYHLDWPNPARPQVEMD